MGATPPPYTHTATPLCLVCTALFVYQQSLIARPPSSIPSVPFLPHPQTAAFFHAHTSGDREVAASSSHLHVFASSTPADATCERLVIHWFLWCSTGTLWVVMACTTLRLWRWDTNNTRGKQESTRVG